jgi:glycosyltransferase involved in cell wall biosynthesis
MRLLSVNNFHYRRAGSDAAFLDHDALFSARGWETAAFSMHHEENLPSPWTSFFVEEVELKRTYSLMTKVRLAGKILYSSEARKQLERLLNVFEPDVVHLHSLYHHISPSILPTLHALGVPIVMTAHDYKLACPAYKMFDGQRICEDCKGGRVAPLIKKRCIHGSAAMSAFVAIESALHRSLGSYER